MYNFSILSASEHKKKVNFALIFLACTPELNSSCPQEKFAQIWSFWKKIKILSIIVDLENEVFGFWL